RRAPPACPAGRRARGGGRQASPAAKRAAPRSPRRAPTCARSSRPAQERSVPWPRLASPLGPARVLELRERLDGVFRRSGQHDLAVLQLELLGGDRDVVL